MEIDLPHYNQLFSFFLNLEGVEKIKSRFYNAIDRQFGAGGIPPALVMVGATTAVATGGILVQTGVYEAVVNAITDFIGKLTPTFLPG